MIGTIALHGGGEFLTGDEPFLEACLLAARAGARVREDPTEPGAAAGRGTAAGPAMGDGRATVRVVVVPAAAADQRPELAAGHGVAALRRMADRAGIAVRAEAAMVVDPASAADPSIGALLAGADLIHVPGGDPGRLLEILDGSDAWRAIAVAHARGAVVAGASAGAMALAAWSWTPRGWRAAIGLVPGIVVVPHAERVGRGDGWSGTFGATVPPAAEPVGRLGLDERTGVLIAPSPERPGGRVEWRVAGAGRAHWSPDAATAPLHAAHGDLLRTI